MWRTLTIPLVEVLSSALTSEPTLGAGDRALDGGRHSLLRRRHNLLHCLLGCLDRLGCSLGWCLATLGELGEHTDFFVVE